MTTRSKTPKGPTWQRHVSWGTECTTDEFYYYYRLAIDIAVRTNKEHYTITPLSQEAKKLIFDETKSRYVTINLPRDHPLTSILLMKYPLDFQGA